MNADISKVLAYEVKKELADRYFGFRKFIEQEKENLDSQVKHVSLTVELKICRDLVRIYIMLQDKDLIRTFFELTGLNEEVYFDSYAIQSPTIKKCVFKDVKTKGLTRTGRFKTLLLTCYDNLARHIDEYRETVSSMLVEHETIVEEINLFHRKTDITQIMGFLRTLDADNHPGNCLQHASTGLVLPGHLEEKMKVSPPEPIEHHFSNVQPIPALPLVKKNLKKLAEQAYKRSPLLPDEY
jgi:hypothetical protein